MSILNTFNLNRLTVFFAVIEAGTITAAAERLGMSKAIASTHRQKLEATCVFDIPSCRVSKSVCAVSQIDVVSATERVQPNGFKTLGLSFKTNSSSMRWMSLRNSGRSRLTVAQTKPKSILK